MKGAPNFKQWPDSVDGRWKMEFLRWLGKITGIKILVETGTCEGVTPHFLQNDFTEIHTVELHPGLFENARARLSDIKHVTQYLGSSRFVLPEIITKLGSRPALFWLDAHSSGPHTADDGNVLPDEILAITKNCPEAVIVVDDMIGIGQFMGQVGASFPMYGWRCEYRTGEILAYKEGHYSIPEFEQ